MHPLQHLKGHSLFFCTIALFTILLRWESDGAAEEMVSPVCHAPEEGIVSRAVMERPVALTAASGRLHQKVSTSSKEAQAYYDQGFAYLASYVWIEAARSFSEALRRDPQLAMAHLGLAKAYAGAEALAEVQVHLQKAQELAETRKVTPKEAKWIALAVQQAEALNAPAEERVAKHNAYKQAVDELIILDPSDPHAWVLRGNAEEPGVWGRGQAGGVGSIAFYEAALQRDPDHFAAHHFLVHSYERIGHHAIAAEHGHKYAAAVKQVPHASHMYAHVLPRVGKWQEALKQLTLADHLEREYYKAEKISAGQDWHHGHNLHLLGTVQLRLGNEAETERLFQEAFHLQDYGRRSGYYSSPWIEYLLARGRYEEALSAAQEVEKRPSAAARLIGAALQGEALVALGRIEEAQQAHARAKTAAEAYVQDARNTPYESFSSRFTEPLLKTLEGEIALHGNNPAAGEEMLVKVADGFAASPLLDAWAVGLLHLQRVTEYARQAGKTALATALIERVRKIDPEFAEKMTASTTVATVR
jgi:tetratricopeptide (TPR) repeat protein